MKLEIVPITVALVFEELRFLLNVLTPKFFWGGFCDTSGILRI